MGKELDYTGDGVRTVKRGFRAAHNLDLVHVIQSEDGEIDSATGRIDGRAVDQYFGEIGIAAIQEQRGSPPLAPVRAKVRPVENCSRSGIETAWRWSMTSRVMTSVGAVDCGRRTARLRQ